MRAGLPEHGPPLLLGPLFGVVHRHHSDIATSVCFFDVRLKGSSGGGDAVVDEDGCVLGLFHYGEKGLQKLDTVFVGPVPEDVSQHVRENFVCGFDGLLLEHVALVELDPLLQFRREGLLALSE